MCSFPSCSSEATQKQAAWLSGKGAKVLLNEKQQKKSSNLFKNMAKYLAETTELDILKHKEIIFIPSPQNPE